MLCEEEERSRSKSCKMVKTVSAVSLESGIWWACSILPPIRRQDQRNSSHNLPKILPNTFLASSASTPTARTRNQHKLSTFAVS